MATPIGQIVAWLTKRIILTAAILSLVISAAVSGLVVTVLKPAQPSPFFIVQGQASASANLVRVTVHNPWDQQVTVRNAVIQAVRTTTITFLNSISTETLDVLWGVSLTEVDIDTYPPARPTTTATWSIPDTIPMGLEEVFGKCSPDCHECLLDLRYEIWNPEGLRGIIRLLESERHVHQTRTYTAVSDIIELTAPVVFSVQATNASVTLCYEVKGVYDVPGSVRTCQTNTLEISLAEDWVFGYRIDLTEGEYIIVTLYDAEGRSLGQSLVRVGS